MFSRVSSEDLTSFIILLKPHVGFILIFYDALLSFAMLSLIVFPLPERLDMSFIFFPP